MWVPSLGQEEPLEEALGTHSSTLAWRTPWTEEPGGLQSTDYKELDTAEHAHTHTKLSLCHKMHINIVPFLG